ncbi:hypothetical protein [Methylibium sp.]|uniref:hypothetical protein n=1 Tax=Methylibium sp. TaxID=2067992 RepID=UPI0017F99917|nr:hypothetical protein [Methylibium sp.]MBA3588755.1 hypothetical protein [Methylibium sp.]
MPQFLVSLVAVIAMVAIHLLVGRLSVLSGTPRSRWLSIAGGVSVAYVFLHLLPELSEGQDVLSETTSSAVAFADRHVYLIALAGLVAFYGLERFALTSRYSERSRQREDATSAGVFALHIASFAAYNVLIGYLLLHRNTSDTPSLVFFALAMALHFLVTDFGLHEHHKSRYDRVGRWVLAVAVLGGWLLGLYTQIEATAIVVLIALVAGGVILNVMKEELPERRESRFSAFLLGVAAYAVLLLAM